MTLTIISSGVDSLYASAKGNLWDGLFSVLGHVRDLNPEQEIVFDFRSDGGSFLRSPATDGAAITSGSPR